MQKQLIGSLVLVGALVASPVFAQVVAPVALPKFEAVRTLVEAGKLPKLTEAYGLSGQSNAVAAALLERLEADVAAGGKRAEAATEVLEVLTVSAEKGKLAWGAESKFSSFASKLEAIRKSGSDVVATAKAEVVSAKAAVGQKAAVSPAALAEGYLRAGLISNAEFEGFVADTQNVPAALILGEKGLNCPTDWRSKDAQIALFKTVREVAKTVDGELSKGIREDRVNVCGAWRGAVSQIVGVTADAAKARVATLAGPDCKIPPVACMTN